MITQYENKQIKLNYDLKGHKKGDIITTRFRDGVCLDPYWRDRQNDCIIEKYNGCVECITILDSTSTPIEATTKTTVTKKKVI